ncbi:MAG: type II secretion system F family protein [Acidimicrobiales bacterium]
MTGSSWPTAWPAVAVGAAVLIAAAPAGAAPRRVRRLALDARDRVSSEQSNQGDRRRIRSWLHAPLAPLEHRAIAAAARVRRRLGRPADVALDRRLAGAGAAGALVGLWHPASGVAVGLVVWVGVGARTRSATRRRADALVDEVPDLVELFRLAIAAGLTVHLAVAAVSSRFGGVLGESLARVPARVALGERLADALEGLADCGEPVRPLATTLAAAARYGDPLAPVLERLSTEARMVRRRHAEEAARRLPVQLLFPLVLCVLPAFVLLAVAPLLLAAVPQLPH